MIEHRVGAVEFLDLPSLAPEQNLKLTSDYMEYFRQKIIIFDNNNETASENITDQMTNPVNGFNCKSEGIIQSKQPKTNL